MQSFNSQESIGDLKFADLTSTASNLPLLPLFNLLVLTHPGSRRLRLPMRKSRSHALPLFLFAFIVL